MPSIVSINVGQPKERVWAGIGRTSIDKQPVTGPVAVGPLGIAGDQVSDTAHHGGLDQAVYAFAREDLDRWEQELGRPIRSGGFGENLTTEGLDVNGAVVGTRWQVGEVVFEVASVRIPCNDFKNWMRVEGYDDSGWVKRFTANGDPGPYLRVLQPGEITIGDPIEVIHVPAHGVTIRDMFAALTTDRRRLPELAVIDALPAEVRAKVAEFGRS